jgi:tripartite-type tricarboxylate transporter receptor subunit TctC
MIVPFAAGGPTDVIGRILATRMRASLRQPVIVENMPRAAGNLGVGRVDARVRTSLADQGMEIFARAANARGPSRIPKGRK